jgi:hypothetical protein
VRSVQSLKLSKKVSHGVVVVMVIAVPGGFSIDIGFSMVLIPTVIGFFGQGFGNRRRLGHLHRRESRGHAG